MSSSLPPSAPADDSLTVRLSDPQHNRQRLLRKASIAWPSALRLLTAAQFSHSQSVPSCLRKNNGMRSQLNLIMLAGAALIVGLLLVYVFHGSDSITFGTGSGADVPVLPTILLVTARCAIGILLIWLATLLLAGVIGIASV